MRPTNPVDASISNSDYCELSPNSLHANSNPENRTSAQLSKFSGSVHRGAKAEQLRRKVTFGGEQKSGKPTHYPLVESNVSPSAVSFPPEIELSSARPREETDASSSPDEDKESLARLQLLIRLGFDAYFCKQDKQNKQTPDRILRRFWIHEDLDDGHILLWADCERRNLYGAVPLQDMEQLEREEKTGLTIGTRIGELTILFLSAQERDFWTDKLELLMGFLRN